MTCLYEQVRDSWLASKLPANAPAPAAELEAFEAMQGFRLPLSLRTYLSVVNGLADWAMDEHLLCFLPLDRIAEETAERGLPPEGQVDIVFADFLIFSHWFVLRATLDGAEWGIFWAADGWSAEPLRASCFDEFLAAYIRDPDAVSVGNC